MEKMEPYYEDNHIKLFNKDCQDMSELPDESVDLIVTDPPYQLSTIERFGKPDSGEKWNVKSGVYHRIDKGFMGQEWDVLPPVEVWRECLRVLKPGAFAFIMTTTRQDSLCQILMDLAQAGFSMGFSSIYWAYASGFPKAQNIAKSVMKRVGDKGEVVGRGSAGYQVSISKTRKEQGYRPNETRATKEFDLVKPTDPQAKALDGSYGGFQPKPAVEVILVVMKPLSEKTFVDQALKNRKGITWLDDGRIPYESEEKVVPFQYKQKPEGYGYEDREDKPREINPQGRFPANLLVSDDVLNDGKTHHSGKLDKQYSSDTTQHIYGKWGRRSGLSVGDSGSFSRYFDLDKWWAKTFPFLVVPKASKSEKNKGLEGIEAELGHNRFDTCANCGGYILQNPDRPSACHCENPIRQHNKIKGNFHPTVKPLKLMSYLVMLGSREGDTVLDPFVGSGTTALAAKLLNRKCIGIEIEKKYCEIAACRCRQMILGL